MSTIQWICLFSGIVGLLSAFKSSDYSTQIRRDNMGGRSLEESVRNKIINKSWLWAGIAFLTIGPFLYGFGSYVLYISFSWLHDYANKSGTMFLMGFCLLAGSLIALYFVSQHLDNEASLIGGGLVLIGVSHSLWMFVIGGIIWLGDNLQIVAGR